MTRVVKRSGGGDQTRSDVHRFSECREFVGTAFDSERSNERPAGVHADADGKPRPFGCAVACGPEKLDAALDGTPTIVVFTQRGKEQADYTIAHHLVDGGIAINEHFGGREIEALHDRAKLFRRHR